MLRRSGIEVYIKSLFIPVQMCGRYVYFAVQRKQGHRLILSLFLIACCYLPDVFAQQYNDGKKEYIAHQILDAAARNGTLLHLGNDYAHCLSGLQVAVIPSDERSLAWGVIRLSDAHGNPLAYEMAEIAVSDGTLHLIDGIPQTDVDGNLIFAIQSPLGREGVAQVRFYFPRICLEGRLFITFCSQCYVPASDCPSIQDAATYDMRPAQAVCSSSEFADFAGFEARDTSSRVIEIQEVSFHPLNRPLDAFSPITLGIYSICCNPGCYRRPYCVDCQANIGHIENTDRFFSHLLPNDDVEARVRYLVYNPGGAGIVCYQNSVYTVKNPSLVIDEDASNSLFVLWHSDPALRRNRVRISVESPLISRLAPPAWDHYGWTYYLQVEVGNSVLMLPVNVPTEQMEIEVRPTDFDYRDYPRAIPFNVRLMRRTYPNYPPIPEEVDTARGYLDINIVSIFALGRNPSTRTFDFEVTYTLSLSRQLSVTRGASAGIFRIIDPANEEIYRVNVPSEKLSLGQHTIVIQIPEDRMTRFGSYVFLPNFIDDLAGYYRDRRPRAARVMGNLIFTTPDTVYPQLAYTISSLPSNQRGDVRRLSFPLEGDEVFIVATMGGYLYEPIPSQLHNARFIVEDVWGSDGGARRPNPASNQNLSDFLERSFMIIPYFANNRQAEQLRTSFRLWPGPKLEFCLLRLTHRAITEPPRLYQWEYEDAGRQPASSWIARVGTHYYAMAVSAPSLNYYVVSGPGLGRNGNQVIDKREFEQRLRSRRLTSRHASTGFNAPLRISVKRLYPNLDTAGYKRRVIEWATAFVGVSYEMGGCWFGGRAHPTQRDEYYGYQGFGIDCSKLVSASAMMAGLRWDRRLDNGQHSQEGRRWWDIGAAHLAQSPYTSGWRSPAEARLNAQPGDILVCPGVHVIIIIRFTDIRDIRERHSNRVVDRELWIEGIDSSGYYNGVTINNATHLLPRGRPRVGREDTVGILTEYARRRYVLRALCELR